MPHCERNEWFGSDPICKSQGPFRKVKAVSPNGIERDFTLCEPDAVWIESWDDRTGKMSKEGRQLYEQAKAKQGGKQ